MEPKHAALFCLHCMPHGGTRPLAASRWCGSWCPSTITASARFLSTLTTASHRWTQCMTPVGVGATQITREHPHTHTGHRLLHGVRRWPTSAKSLALRQVAVRQAHILKVFFPFPAKTNCTHPMLFYRSSTTEVKLLKKHSMRSPVASGREALSADSSAQQVGPVMLLPLISSPVTSSHTSMHLSR